MPGRTGWGAGRGHPADEAVAIALGWYSIVVDSEDHRGLAGWWADVLGWRVTHADEGEASVAPTEGAEPRLCFVPVPEVKTVKNRLHIDLAPDDRDAEVERLLALGARHADMGQTNDVTWVVLCDPEGNELCVLSSR